MSSMDAIEAKQLVCDEVDRLAETLIDVSHQIHAKPELCFEEHFAHELLTGVIEDAGLPVERGAYEMPTAFDSRTGPVGAPTVAVLCEYDALPKIGHACGHNIIAAAGLGAGLAAASRRRSGRRTTSDSGTPAEEGGGGKVFMIRRGCFDDVDASMMVHPANHELQTFHTLAIHTLHARYLGVAAHAAAAPQLGRNALDAAVFGYNAIAALRQHIEDDERVHGIFTDGGAKPNIVPSSAASEWYVRSSNVDSLEDLKQRVVDCLQAGAQAAGCDVEIDWVDPPFADMVDNRPLLESYVANAREVGRDPAVGGEIRVVGSTDMGNVSYTTPAIHPMIKVAPDHVPIHSPEFAEHARSATGDRAVIDGAKAMAMTVVDCWIGDGTLAAARQAFESS